MPKLKNIVITSTLFFTCLTASATEPANSNTPKTTQAKSLMIIFYPPPGRELEFLNVFVKNQSEHMQKYTNTNPSPTKVESINIAPTKNGEPLIHLMIYRDQDAYNKAVKTFSSREQLFSYMSNHATLYGGEKIEADFLKHSKIHFGEVISDPVQAN
ncbi:hypothetical protein [Pseudomonas sp. NFX98]|uniref:hypothetical protein n=1 Tax=Pseudomonas sp. NFX98 TaxID=3399122 RepID=UPI0039FC75C9